MLELSLFAALSPLSSLILFLVFGFVVLAVVSLKPLLLLLPLLGLEILYSSEHLLPLLLLLFSRLERCTSSESWLLLRALSERYLSPLSVYLLSSPVLRRLRFELFQFSTRSELSLLLLL